MLSLTGLGAHIQISPQAWTFTPHTLRFHAITHTPYHYLSLFQISLLQQYPHLQQYIKPAIEKTVQDLLGPVVERSAKIALTTTEHIIKKVT